jgi:hypothetical protein
LCGWTWISFSTPSGDGFMLRRGDVSWVWGDALGFARLDGGFDEGELTLDLAGDELVLRLVSDGQTWSGVATPVSPPPPSTPLRGGKSYAP